MKEFSKQYYIRECSLSRATHTMFSYNYTFSNNSQEFLFATPSDVIDYSNAYYMFPIHQIYAPEVHVTTKYEVQDVL